MWSKDVTNMQFAKLKWNDQQPYSLDFDDVYYSVDNGLAETDHVFIHHNQLIERFKQLDTLASGSPTFTIVETGFGTGLNFFVQCNTFWHTHQQMPTCNLSRPNALRLH